MPCRFECRGFMKTLVSCCDQRKLSEALSAIPGLYFCHRLFAFIIFSSDTLLQCDTCVQLQVAINIGEICKNVSFGPLATPRQLLEFFCPE